MSTATVPSAKGFLQRDAHEAVGSVGDALLGDGRTQDVLEEGLASGGIQSADAGGACKVKPSCEAQRGLSSFGAPGDASRYESLS